MTRRPPLMRSMAGPTSGATMAKGAIVKSRYSATLSRAAPDGIEKNNVPASDTVTNVSVATENACTRASRVNGVTVNASAADRRGRDSGRQLEGEGDVIRREVAATARRPSPPGPPGAPT